MADQASRFQRCALLLLAAGTVLGIAFGVVSALRESSQNDSAVPDDAIALVNGKSITKEDYTRAVAMLANDKRTDIIDADRAYVLNRLIDEELLIHHGIDIGLVESDRAVRKAITQAMLTAIVAEHTSEQASDDMLRAFSEENPSLFVRSTPGSNVRMAAGRMETPPSFDEIKEQVEEAYLQRARDNALHEYLEWLRSEAEISLASDSLSFPTEGEGQDRKYGRQQIY